MTSDTNLQVDVAIAGAGPAGALLAIRLARLGLRVVCVNAAARGGRIEGLGQRTIDVMRANQLSNALAAVRDPVPRHAVWADTASDYNRECIVARDELDRGLLADVAAAGVDVVHGRCTMLDGNAGLAVRRADGARVEIRARFVVEARGRAAPRPRTGGLRGPETTALTRRLQQAGAPATMIESMGEGWAWYVSDGQQALLQIFVDSTEGLPKRHDLTGHFERLSGYLPAIAERMGPLIASGPVMTRNTTTSLAQPVAGASTLRLGDAAAAIDPLSGHGVFAAFGSALAASASINTILRRPENTPAAIRFYEERAVHGAWRNARIARDFYRLEERWVNEGFWRARRSWPDDKPVHGDAGAFAASVQVMPVVADGFIKERPVVVTADHPRGVWRVDDVDLVVLLEAAGETSGALGESFIAAMAGRLAVRPGQVMAALNWLRQAGALA